MSLCAILGAAIVIALHWIGGYDFNERGAIAVGCALFSLWGATVGAFASTLFHEEKP